MDKKITALTDLGSGIASADLFHIVDDPTGTPINKKISAANVFNYIPTFIATNSTEALTNTSTAVSVSTAVSTVDSSGGAVTVTLAAGVTGQLKTIICTTAGNNITVTPAATVGSGTTVVLDAAGESATLMYTGTAWCSCNFIFRNKHCNNHSVMSDLKMKGKKMGDHLDTMLKKYKRGEKIGFTALARLKHEV